MLYDSIETTRFLGKQDRSLYNKQINRNLYVKITVPDIIMSLFGSSRYLGMQRKDSSCILDKMQLAELPLEARYQGI